MSTYNAVVWLPLCAGLTGLGLVASWFAFRRRGLGSGLRGAAWSLLPLAAYLTGSIKMFYKIGTAIGDYAASFVLSPKVWSGVGVAALAAVLFVVSGPAKRRRRRRASAEADGTKPATGPEPAVGGRPGQETAIGSRRARKALEPTPARAAKSGSSDDDLSEVEEILRRHGIN